MYSDLSSVEKINQGRLIEARNMRRARGLEHGLGQNDNQSNAALWRIGKLASTLGGVMFIVAYAASAAG